MSDCERELPGSCVDARAVIHEMLDGPVQAERGASLEQHLSECDACAAFRDELALVRTALRELPEIPMPDDALDDVWDRTVRADENIVCYVPRARSWRALAAAALVIVVTLAVWMLQRAPENGPSPDEVRVARAQLEQVLGLTGSALGKTQNAAFERVIKREISPALRRIPILGSGVTEPATRRNES